MFKETIVALAFLCCPLAHGAERPNFLWLSTEDMSPHLGCYGEEHARTPNIDALAAKGVLFQNAFVPSPVCATCRSSFITGVYSTSLGTHHMRSRVKLPPEIRCFTEYLRVADYYCTNNAKEDYNFRTPKSAWDESSGRAHWRNRPRPDQQFFAVFNYTGTHESSVRGDEPKYSNTIAALKPEELHDPASLDLPPYYPDTPKVRAHWARYYNTIMALDKWVAERLAELENAGLADNTIVFFWSDHGAGLPRAKRWLYDSGLRVPLIVHMPEKFRRNGQGSPGARLEQMVSLVDLAPTMLNLAGLPIPAYMQGQPFLGDHVPRERQYIYASRDRMDESYDMVRAVRDKHYKYIRNFMPWRPYAQYQSYGENNDVMRELRRQHAEGKLTPEQALFMRDLRPVEELYDLDNDPHELHNLAADKSYKFVKKRLKGELRPWMLFTRDLGVVPEGILDRTVGPNSTLYGLFRRVGGEREYGDLLGSALHATAASSAKTVDIPWEGIGLSMLNDDSEPAVAYWGAQVFALAPLYDNKNAVYESIKKDEGERRRRDAAVRTMAAEMILRGAKGNQTLEADALSSLLDVYQNGDSRWDQIAAANVIDLVPDFEKVVAPKLAPVNRRVRKQLRPADPNDLGADMLRRWIERFNERIKVKSELKYTNRR